MADRFLSGFFTVSARLGGGTGGRSDLLTAKIRHRKEAIKKAFQAYHDRTTSLVVIFGMVYAPMREKH